MSEGNLHTLTGMKMCHYFGYLSWGASGFLGIIFWYNLISLGIIQISGSECRYFILNDIVESSLQGSGYLFSSVRFKVQMKCFFYSRISKSSKTQEDRHLPFLYISSSSRVIKV